MACSNLSRGLPGFSGPPGPAGPPGPPGPGGNGSFPAFFFEVAVNFDTSDDLDRNDRAIINPGKQFTSIQSAIEHAKTLSLSPSQTALIWIAPGVYNEDITLYENICLLGSGLVSTAIVGNFTFEGTTECVISLSSLNINTSGSISFSSSEIATVFIDRVLIATNIFNVRDVLGFYINDSLISPTSFIWNTPVYLTSIINNSEIGVYDTVFEIGTDTFGSLRLNNSRLRGTQVNIGSSSGDSELFLNNCYPVENTVFTVNDNSTALFYGTRISQTSVTGDGIAGFDIMQAILTIDNVGSDYFFNDPYDPDGAPGSGFGTVTRIRDINYNVILTPYSLTGVVPTDIPTAMILQKTEGSIKLISSVEHTFIVTILSS